MYINIWRWGRITRICCIGLISVLSFFNQDESIMNDSKASTEKGYQLPIKQNLCQSININETSYYGNLNKSTTKNSATMKSYESFKNVLRKSFRKSKIFLKKKKNFLAKPVNFATSNLNLTSGRHSYTDLEFDIEENIHQKIGEAVSVCRQLPDLEISMEMVEVERLLLFSSLRKKNFPRVGKNYFTNQKYFMRLFVNEMHLPVLRNVNDDMYFNFFYIVTFECSDVIISSQSSECKNGVAIFPENTIEFFCSSEVEAYNLNAMTHSSVKCNIFMLRLRKLSADLIEEKQVRCIFKNNSFYLHMHVSERSF